MEFKLGSVNYQLCGLLAGDSWLSEVGVGYEAKNTCTMLIWFLFAHKPHRSHS